MCSSRASDALGQSEREFVAYCNHQQYHESLSKLSSADLYFGQGESILEERAGSKKRPDKKEDCSKGLKPFRLQSMAPSSLSEMQCRPLKWQALLMLVAPAVGNAAVGFLLSSCYFWITPRGVRPSSVFKHKGFDEEHPERDLSNQGSQGEIFLHSHHGSTNVLPLRAKNAARITGVRQKKEAVQTCETKIADTVRVLLSPS